MSSGWGFDDNEKPPDNPSKVIYHGPYGKDIPEEYRRVFGSPPPKNAKKPIPPPPPPPNSYHKKPKYWQMRYTSHAQVPNRVAGVMCAAMIGVAYLLHKFSKAPERWDKRIGYGMTPEEKLEYDRKNQFYYQVMLNSSPEHFATDLTGEKFINVRRADNKIRWDLREVDKEVLYTRDMANPMDDPL